MGVAKSIWHISKIISNLVEKLFLGVIVIEYQGFLFKFNHGNKRWFRSKKVAKIQKIRNFDIGFAYLFLKSNQLGTSARDLKTTYFYGFKQDFGIFLQKKIKRAKVLVYFLYLKSQLNLKKIFLEYIHAL